MAMITAISMGHDFLGQTGKTEYFNREISKKFMRKAEGRAHESFRNLEIEIFRPG